VEAADAYSALDLLETSTPDLFILDVMMPGMDGIELCKRIRARPETSTTPILMLSAKNDAKTIKNGLEAGANDYMVKPPVHQDLVGRVRKLLT
jgi:DNA-binding response OmpR family regulator